METVSGKDTRVLNLGDSPQMMFLRTKGITEIARVTRRQGTMPRIRGKNRQQKWTHSLQVLDLSDTDFKTTILYSHVKLYI